MPVENRAALSIATASLLAAIVSLVTLSGDAQVIAATVLFGLVGIALFSFAFLLAGQSEESDRRRHPWG